MAVSGHKRSSVAVSGHKWLNVAVSGHKRSSVSASGHKKSSVAASGHKRLNVTVSGHYRLNVTISGHKRIRLLTYLSTPICRLGFPDESSATHLQHVNMSLFLTLLGCVEPIIIIIALSDHNTMQLYLKIEHTYGDCSRRFNPQFKQITTNTEFTLAQALENILDGELEHYQIIGPGLWVQWATLAKELKGQQLTLLYQSPNENTEIKRTIPFMTNYSRVDVSNLLNLERDHTKIDNLKLDLADQSSFSSVKSDSNNVTSECDLSIDMSLFNNKPSSLTLSLSSLENNVDEFTLDFQTETKTPLVMYNTTSSQQTPFVTYNPTSSQQTPLATYNPTSSQITPLATYNTTSQQTPLATNKTTSSQLTKTFRDKCVYDEEAGDTCNLLSQVVPNFSIIEKDEVEVDSHQNEVKRNNLSCNYQCPLPAVNSYSDDEDWGPNYTHGTRWVVLPNEIELGINIGSLDTLPTLDSVLPQPTAHHHAVTTSSDAVDPEYVTPSFIEAVYGRSPSISLARRRVQNSHQDPNSLPDDPPSKRQLEQVLPVPEQSTHQHSVQRHLNETRAVMPHAETALLETQETNFYRYTPPPPHHPANLPQFVDKPPLTPGETFSHHGNTVVLSDSSRCVASFRNNSQGRKEHYMAMHGHNQIFSNQPDNGEHFKATHVRHNSFPCLINSSFSFTRNMPGVRNSEYSSNGYMTNGSVTYTPVVGSMAGTQLKSHFESPELFDIFHLSHPTHDALGQPMQSSLISRPGAAKKNGMMIKSYSSDATHGCNYIDSTRQVSQKKSIKVEDDLTQIEGWKPKENGDTILKTMEPYRNHDGVYVLWKSRRHQNFVLTVSHQQQYIHLRINECTQNNKKIFYIYENGFCSDSLLELITHYKINGIKVKVCVKNCMCLFFYH
ncbi:hypothetical protein Btru_069883 [Bulinus truncatus]|nr:hypothetical protein Btru_069883 [Bulinus truncatus]